MAKKQKKTDFPRSWVEIRPLRLAVGALLVEARKAKGLSQAKLGELADIPSVKIHRIEHGADWLSIDVLWRLCEAIGDVRPSTILQSAEARLDAQTELDQAEQPSV